MNDSQPPVQPARPTPPADQPVNQPADPLAPPAPSAPGNPWATGTTEVLDAGGAAVPRQAGGRRGLAIGLGAGAVALVVGGGAYAWTLVGGGGDQPEDHLPASVAAVVKVDLDPSAGQKIDAIRFAAKFPLGKGLEDREDTDLRRWVYETLTKDAESAPAWSEIDPWLGDRAAMAVAPDPADAAVAIPLMAVEVTDEARARASLEKLDDGDTGFVVADGWAVVSDTTEHAEQAAAAAKDTPLARDATFAADVDRLGDAGVARMWLDGKRLVPLLGGGATGRPPGSSLGGILGSVVPGVAGGVGTGQDPRAQALTGHGAMALRFSGPALELVGRFTGTRNDVVLGRGPSGIADLPDGTLVGFGVADAGTTVTSQVERVLDGLAEAGNGQAGAAEAIETFERESGLRFPEDVSALLGERLGLAVAGPDDAGEPQVGLRVASSSPDLGRALTRLQALMEESGTPLERRDVEGGYVLAGTPGQAEAMVQGGALGAGDRFRDAVPDAASAPVVGYLDIAGMLDAYGSEMSEDDRASFRPLSALGMTLRSEDGSGEETAMGFTLRLTTR